MSINISNNARIKFRTVRTVLFFSTLLMAMKFIAYFMTHSIAILSDALESIINIVAGSFALFSIFYSSLPKDDDHPYGHGKIENISAGFEGALIVMAGISMIAEAIYSYFHPHPLERIDIGILLSGITGICNWLMGKYLIIKGKKYNSLTLLADGKHLISDTISSIGLIAGLTLIYFTHIIWIDSLLAIIFGFTIFFTGYKLIRESVFNLLDKIDIEKLSQFISIINKQRRTKWIDMHNLRILKYGSQLHIDAHLTLPWYENLEKSHEEMREMEKIVKENMGDEIELFIHADPCVPASCPICIIENCQHRKSPFVKRLDWTMENLLPNTKHKIL